MLPLICCSYAIMPGLVVIGRKINTQKTNKKPHAKFNHIS